MTLTFKPGKVISCIWISQIWVFPLLLCVSTGANVHDSQVSFPLEKLTEKNATYLYSVMNAAFDAPQIWLYSEGQGRVALIDQNKRRSDSRMPMDPAEKQHYKICSVVERANAHLKD